MAPAYFLEIDGIPGDGRDPERPGRLELTSFTWGESAEPHDLRRALAMQKVEGSSPFILF
jgi:hypothetical protein